ncbi:MAG: rhomboid family intramembrane serine protease [Verrucomicrobia bacterium]|nr:rhomboid family intramembrane serine protease [Verrucomicrobiota bacterium]
MDPAPLPAATPSPEISFAVEYQGDRHNGQNPDLYERGVFTAKSDGTFRFSGRRRALVGGEQIELEYGAADITNVDATGRTVWFSTTKGRAGAQKNPFVFHCRDAEGARAVVQLLPKTVDAGHVSAAVFQEKLRQLPGARAPFESVTGVLLGLNVAVFVVMAGAYGAGWMSVASMDPYIRFGANHGAATTDGEWWRLLTSMFMHYGAMHLLLNMWALFQAGQLLERLQGRAFYAFNYLASGVAGGLLSLVWHGQKAVWSAGASGAVFGVYGMMLGFVLKEKHAIPRIVFKPLQNSAVSFGAYNLLFGLVYPGIDNAAHVGGFVAGIGLGWLTAMPIDREKRRQLWRGKFGAAAAAVAMLVAVGVTAAPRFDFSFREEFGWSTAIKGFRENEAKLLEKQDAAVGQWRQSAAGGPSSSSRTSCRSTARSDAASTR